MSGGIVLVVRLFIYPGYEDAFRRFETAAARIMRRYGGRIDQVIRPLISLNGKELPHEIHVVSFPSMERFEAYRRDAELAELAALRQSTIARTEIMVGEEGEPYA